MEKSTIINITVFFLVLIIASPVPADSLLDQVVFPPVIGRDPSFFMKEPPRIFSAEGMFEHVNGEAELLKRYGAIGLSYALYETQSGDSVSIDLIDMVTPENAYGLYRLYAGCDEGSVELEISGGRVLKGDFTVYAQMGSGFFRINTMTEGRDWETSRVFIGELFARMPSASTSPAALAVLKDFARSPCDVSYNPDDVDYDLEAGPGYKWVADNDLAYFLRSFTDRKDALSFGASLREKSVKCVIVDGDNVAWTSEVDAPCQNYLEKFLSALSKKTDR